MTAPAQRNGNAAAGETLFTGLTGTVGREIMKLLPRFDIPARGLVRKAEQAPLLEAAGVRPVLGDLGDDAALAKALAGCGQAFLLTANDARQLEWEEKFIDRAAAAGVRRLVKLSAVGADENSPALLKRWHGVAERRLRESGLRYAIVRPGFFMQNLLHCAAEIAAQNAFSLPMGNGRVGAVDAHDVARFVLTVLSRPDGEDRIYEITGPKVVSFHDMAAQLSAVLGREIRYLDAEPGAFRQALLQWMPDAWYADAVAALFALIAQGHGAMANDEYREATGRAPTTTGQFFRDHAEVFGAPT